MCRSLLRLDRLVQLFAKGLCKCAGFFFSRKDLWKEFCGDMPQAQNFQSKL
jgi:hypothetical protein